MLPACTSPWNGPWTHIASKATFMPLRNKVSLSMSRAAKTSKESIGTPYIRSMQIDAGPAEVPVHFGRGHVGVVAEVVYVGTKLRLAVASSAQLTSWLACMCMSLTNLVACRRFRDLGASGQLGDAVQIAAGRC